MLAELGADVIKVEDPPVGDPIRQLPPFIDGRSVYDLLLNRGKRSMVLDLRGQASQPVLNALLSKVDVVVESFRPATAQRLGVSGSQLRARHPRLIHLALTGYGQTGPYADRPGHDLNYVAVSGVLAADRPEPAHLPRMFMADVGGGAMSAVIAVLAALYGRERSGHGATLDLSMHDAALYWVMLLGARDLIEDGPWVSFRPSATMPATTSTQPAMNARLHSAPWSQSSGARSVMRSDAPIFATGS
jgi:crotonobetainyl-CoA:carnitine CoA-transferase CaiB-like acyl-CoA transferase